MSTCLAPAQELAWIEQPPWRFVTGGDLVVPAVFSTSAAGGQPVADQTTIYALSEDRYLYALSGAGTMRWRYDLSTRPLDFLVASDTGQIYLGRRRGRLLAISAAGGSLWERQFEGELIAPIALVGGQVIAGEREGALSLLSATGHRIWRIMLGAPLSALPIVDSHGRIWTAANDGMITVIDLTGRVRLEVWVAEEVVTLLPVAGGVVIGSADGTLAKIGDSGSGLWRTDVGSAIAALVGNDDLIYARLDDGSLLCISHSGRIEWRAAPEGRVITRIVATDGVFAALDDGRLLSLSSAGTVRWQTETELVAPTLSPEGYAVGARADWIINAVPTPAVPCGEWAYERGDRGSRGRPQNAALGRVALGELQDDLEFAYLSELFASPIASDRSRALQDVRSRVAAGELAGSYHGVLYILDAIAVGRSGPLSELARASEGDLQLRSAAIALLASIGDRRSIDTLASAADPGQPEPVRVAALQSIARLAAAAPRRAAEVALSVVQSSAPSAPQPATGAAVLGLIAAVTSVSGGVANEMIADALSLLVDGALGADTARDAAVFSSHIR